MHGWLAIDHAEKALGAAQGRPRIRLDDRDGPLAPAGLATPRSRD
jgi:hypothetical protein